MLLHPSLRAVAVEARADRAARIAANAGRSACRGLRVVEGAAPAALAGLPAPDAVFIGGGGSDAGVLEAAMAALPAGRAAGGQRGDAGDAGAARWTGAERLGGDAGALSVARAAPVGGMTGWRPAMPVMQWAWVKP